MADKNNESKTLQVDIVKRFMSDEEWYAFRKEYWKNRHTQQGRTRTITLSRVVAPEEKEMLIAYTQDTEVPYAELKRRFKGHDVAYQAGRAAIRIVHQNPEILSRI